MQGLANSSVVFSAAMAKLLCFLIVAAFVAVASASYCRHPPRPKYGYHTGNQNYYPVGYKIYYRCYDGYKLWGYSYNKCIYDSDSYKYYWRYRTPKCIKDHDDGTDHSDSSDSSDDSSHSDSSSHDSSDSDSDSTTTGRKRCPRLYHPRNGRVYVDCYYYKCWAVYRCNDGYDLKGYSRIQCKKNGYWSWKPPKCVYAY